MDKVLNILYKCNNQGIYLWVDQEKLKFKELIPRKDNLKNELFAELKEYKQELIQLLSYNKITSDKLSLPIIYSIDNKNITELSFAQERLWFIDKLESGTNAYNMPIVVKLAKKTNLEYLLQAIATVVDRHEILRSVIRQDKDANAYQEVLVVDQQLIQKLSYSNKEGLNLKLKEAANYIFNLGQDIPIRVEIYQPIDKNADTVLLILMHHIASDGWSIDVLMTEISTLYQYYSKIDSTPHLNTVFPLPELTTQYKDYAQWQRAYLSGEILDKQLAYWQNELVGYENLNLITDKPRPLAMDYVGANIEFSLDDIVSTKLRELAKNLNVSIYSVLLGGYYLLLSTYTNQSDIVVGTPVANRHHEGLENLIGFFVNTLALRYKIDKNKSIAEFLSSVGDKIVLAQEYQDLPFEKLVNILNVEKDQSRNPIFQVMFIMQSYNVNSKKDCQLFEEYHMESNISEIAKFDLTAMINDDGNKLSGVFNYRTSLYNRATIERLVAAYVSILTNLVSVKTNISLNQLSLINEMDKQFLLYEYNQTTKTYPQDKTIPQLFEEQVLRTPNNIAVMYDDRQLTYQELNIKANQLASYLRGTYQIQGDSLIAFCLDRSQHMLVAILAILKSGAAYVPIDPTNPDKRISFILSDTAVKVVLTDKKHKNKLCAIIENTTDAAAIEIHVPQSGGVKTLDCNFSRCTKKYPDIELIDDSKFQNGLKKYISTNLTSVNITGKNLACVIYTSGTTGRPKGVMIRHSGIINRIYWGYAKFPYNHNEICCFKTAISFVDHLAEIFSPLLYGVKILIMGNSVLPINFDLENFINNIAKYKISRLVLVPILLDTILKAADISKLGSVKYYFSSGEYLPQSVANNFIKKLPNTILVNIYGSSEVTADITYHIVAGENIAPSYFKQGLSTVNDAFNGALPHGAISKKNVNIKNLIEYFSSDTLPRNALSDKEYFSEIIHKKLLPNIVNCATPNFIGHMVSVLPSFNYDIYSLLGKLNQNIVKIETSKALTFLEREALAILHKIIFQKDSEFYTQYFSNQNLACGLVLSGGSVANLTSLWAARNNCFPANNDFSGVDIAGVSKALSYYQYSNCVVLVSPMAHYSFDKTMTILGLGKENLIDLKLNEQLQVDIEDMEQKILELTDKKIKVIAVVGIAGTTETGAIDDLEAMADIAHKYGIHFHVDAAFGGAFIFSNEYKYKLRGIEKADSVVVCGHKQLFLPMGISICLFKDLHLAKSIATTADYQATSDSFDLGRYSPEGSRPALSLTLHASLHILGLQGYNEALQVCINNACYMSNLIKKLNCFQLVIEPVLNIVNYRYIPYHLRTENNQSILFDDENNMFINEINSNIQKIQFNNGNSFVSKTIIPNPTYNWQDIVVFRSVLCNPLTAKIDIISNLVDQILIASEISADNNNADLQLLNDLKQVACTTTTFIGKPIHNTKVYILGDNLTMLPIGAVGELYVGGDSLAVGYLGQPLLTRERFIANPFQNELEKKMNTNNVIYKTGDQVRMLSDGNIEYIGRNDSQVKIRGYRIELGEIESKLRDFSAIKQAVVLLDNIIHEINDVVRTTELTDNDKYLVAYYVSDDLLNEADILSFLAEYFPDYMLPSILVRLDHLPLTINGKLDRKALPAPKFKDNSMDYVAPRDELDKALVVIISELLRIEESKLSITANFFRLGGNSILVIKLVSLINKQLVVLGNAKLTVSDIFNYKNIKMIANYIKFDLSTSLIKPMNSSNTSELMFMIHPGAAGCEVYTDMAIKLSDKYKCYGVNNYNIQNKDQISSLYQLAEVYLSYIEQIRANEKINVNAKYNLLGWSLGGKIAIAIADILEKKGISNVQITCLDTTVIDGDQVLSKMHSSMDINIEEFKTIMMTKYKDDTYIDQVSQAVLTEKLIGQHTIQSKLKHTKITLFKAMHKNTEFKPSQEIAQLYQHILDLPYNNIDKIVASFHNVEVILLDCHHGNILDKSEEIACEI